MKALLITLLLSASAFAQIPAPQINLSGNIGCQGFPCLNSGTVIFSSDADRSMTALETSATGGIKIISSTPLTATRKLIMPYGRFQFLAVENATTGGQSITVISSTGTGVTIPNGQTVTLWFDGTNVVQSGVSGGGGTPSGPSYAIQFANAGATAFAADGTFTFAPATHAVTAQVTNGIYNTDLFNTSNNGASNLFTTLCASSPCTAITPPNSPDTGAYTLPPASNQRYMNFKGGIDAEYFKNPAQVQCGVSGSVSSARCTNVFITDPIGRAYANNSYLRGAGPGTAMGFGPNTTAYGTNFTVNTLHYNYLEADSRGIDQMYGNTMFAHSTADKAGSYTYLYTDGGTNYGGDEGGVGGTFLTNENATYYHGTITAGGTTGSNLLTTQNTSGQNNFTDGGYLLDITQGGTVLGAITSTATVGGWGVWNFASSTMPVSTAWGVLNSATNSAATGAYQVTVPQTIPITLNVGASASPGDFATGSNVCLINGFVEQATVTSTPASVAGVQTITFNTRYAWPAGTLIMQGGMCGQMLTDSSASAWRTAVPAIGSFSATQVVPSACSFGVCNNALSAAATVVGTTGTSITQYPGAEIIGTNGGQSNTVQLGVNTAPWTNSDVIEGPHPASVSLHGLKTYVTQYTKANSGGSNLFVESYQGVNPGGSNGLNQTYLNLSDGSSVGNWWRIASGDSTGKLTTLLQDDLPTSNGFIFTVPGQTTNFFTGYQPAGPSAQFGILAQGTTGSFRLYANTSGLAGLQASNVAPLGTVGQISVVDNTTAFGQNVKSVSVSGDATLANTGALTLATVNGAPGSCGDATHVCQVTTSGKGLVTSQSAVAITAAGSISLTTTGTSGLSTLTGSVLNIPNYTYTLPTASTSVLGGVKVDGTSITIASGVISATSGAGTVTHTGALASNKLVLGNGTADVKTDTVAGTDGAGNLTVASIATSGGAGIGGGMDATEGTARTGATGVDNLWADSTSHRLTMNNNNGGAVTVASLSDLASSSAFGVVKVDGTTITASGGVISAAGGGIANTTTTVGTTAIGANTCSSTVTVTMTGVATTSVFNFTPNADVSAVTGWGSTGGLTIVPWPTTNTLNYKVCNQTASSITPGASVTFNVSAK